ncbi:hypothetical protein D9M72_404520 [compost metagenome]
MGRGLLAHRFADHRIDLGLGREAHRLLAVFGLAQRGQVDELDEAIEERIADAGNDHVAVGRRVAVVRHMHEVAVADAFGHMARQQVHRRHVVEQRDLRVEHRDIDMLALAGLVAFHQRGQHAHRAEHAAAEVADRDAAARGARLGRAGDRHAAAHRLHHLVEGRALRVRAGLAEAGDRAGDDARVHRGKRGVVDAQPLGDADAEVVEHHVGLAHEIEKHRLAGRRLEVDAHALLVAVEREVVRAHAVARIVRVVLQQAARAFTAAGRLDLDGARAEVGQQHGAVGAGQHVRQVQHGDVFECHVQCLRKVGECPSYRRGRASAWNARKCLI